MDLIEKFTQAAIEEANATQKGNSREADKYGRKMRELAIKLYKTGRIGELEVLLNHDNLSVRGNAAIKLLPFYTEKAEAVLEELSKNLGESICFVAEITLKEWRKGNINFSYYKK